MSKPKSDGCRSYITTTVDIFFPNGDMCCALCPLMQTYSRNQCMRTGELIADKNGIGMFCPLTVKDDANEM